jgi:3-hydroxyisobutyrate dehydrogenase-like beta-hydroxyacid dehydrogenase
MSERVGFIGLGTMGLPMATNLAKGGVTVVAYDASPAAQAAAARLPGATVAASVADAAAQCVVLFTCLPNDAIVREVYLGAGGIASAARRGLVTCDCSTVSPEVTTALHAALKERGVDHMDTPMLGSQPQAVDGQIFFIVGGEAGRLPAIAPYLEIMGRCTCTWAAPAWPTGSSSSTTAWPR